MNKFSIVKSHIDEMDHYGLLALDAPPDEYDRESKLISNSITDSSTAQEIAVTIAGVFSRQFSDHVNPSQVMACAQQIYHALHSAPT